MDKGWCEVCEKECEGIRCPDCGAVLLQEINPEELSAAEPSWHMDGVQDNTGGLPWPDGRDGEPEEPILLTEMPDFGGRCQLLQSRLRAYSIPSITRYPGGGTLGKVVLGFSGYGVQLFVPASRLEESCKLLDLF